MTPELFDTLGGGLFFLVLAVAVGTAISLRNGHYSGVSVNAYFVSLLIISVASLLGAKAYGLIERGGSVLPFMAELRSGFRYPGAILAIVPAFFIARMVSGVSPALLADTVTPSIGFALAVFRIGCLAGGCCWGTPTRLPWGVTFPSHSFAWTGQVRAGLIGAHETSTLAIHPLQAYFAFVAILLALLSLWLLRIRQYPGQVFLVFTLLYGVSQYALEYLRGSPLPHVQALALASAAMAGVGLIAGHRYRRGQPV